MEDLHDICLPGSAQDLTSGSRSRNQGLRGTCPKEASDLIGVGEMEREQEYQNFRGEKQPRMWKH